MILGNGKENPAAAVLPHQAWAIDFDYDFGFQEYEDKNIEMK